MAIPNDPDVPFDLRNRKSALRRKMAENRSVPGVGTAVTFAEMTDDILADKDYRINAMEDAARGSQDAAEPGAIERGLAGSGVVSPELAARVAESRGRIGKAYERGGPIIAGIRTGIEATKRLGDYITDPYRRATEALGEEFGVGNSVRRRKGADTDQAEAATLSGPSQAYPIIEGYNPSGRAGLRRVFKTKDAQGNSVYSDVNTGDPDAEVRLFDANNGAEFQAGRALLTADQERARVAEGRESFARNLYRPPGQTQPIDPLDLAKFQLDAGDTLVDNARADRAENRQSTTAEANIARNNVDQAEALLEMASDPDDPGGAQRAAALGIASAPRGSAVQLENWLTNTEQGRAWQNVALQNLQKLGGDVGLFRSPFFNTGNSPNLSLQNLSVDESGSVFLSEAGGNLIGDDPEQIALEPGELQSIFGTQDPDIIRALLRQYEVGDGE